LSATITSCSEDIPPINTEKKITTRTKNRIIAVRAPRQEEKKAFPKLILP
jgi:hypothetical protein